MMKLLNTDKPIVLLGSGGHARVVLDCLQNLGQKKILYNSPTRSDWFEKMGIEYVEDDRLVQLAGNRMQMAVGFIGFSCSDLEARYKKMNKLIGYGADFPTIKHPSAIVSETAELGVGSQVLSGAVVNCYSKIKEGVVINTKALVEHQTFVGTGSHLAPNSVVLGGCDIGKFCYLGASCLVVQMNKVNDRQFLKAQSVVNLTFYS